MNSTVIYFKKKKNKMYLNTILDAVSSDSLNTQTAHKVVEPGDDGPANSQNKSSVCFCQPVSSHTSPFTLVPCTHI